MTLVVGFNGCIFLDWGTVLVRPRIVHMGETFTISYIYNNGEPIVVVVSSIDWECYHDGVLYDSGTLDPKSPGWQQSGVPPGTWHVVIWFSGNLTPVAVGNWEHRVVFHLSELWYSIRARGGWTVLP